MISLLEELMQSYRHNISNLPSSNEHFQAVNSLIIRLYNQNCDQQCKQALLQQIKEEFLFLLTTNTLEEVQYGNVTIVEKSSHL